jgi:hypothetical protein
VHLPAWRKGSTRLVQVKTLSSYSLGQIEFAHASERAR